MIEEKKDFKTLAEAAEYSHLAKVSIYDAIKKGKLRASKQPFLRRRSRWMVTKEDLDDYRRNKFNRERAVHKGKLIYDLDEGRWGVYHAAKILSEVLSRPFRPQCIYEGIHRGEIVASKCGSRWIIAKDEILKIYERNLNKEEEQMKFA